MAQIPVLSSDLEKLYACFLVHGPEEHPYPRTIDGFLDWFGVHHCLYDHETGLDYTTFKTSMYSEMFGIGLDRIEDLHEELHDLWDVYDLDYALPED